MRRVALVLLVPTFAVLFMSGLSLTVTENKVLDEDFYKDQLEENGFYSRVYTDVMPEIEEVPEYYGALQISKREAEELSAQIFPPEWLQGEVESVLDDLLPWLRSDTDDLDMTIDLRDNKQLAYPVVRDFVSQKLDGIPDCQPGQVPDLSSISQGTLPECIPGGPDRDSIEGQVLNQAMAVVNASIELAPDTLDLIGEVKSDYETREQFLDDFDVPRQVIEYIVDIPQVAVYGAMAVVLVIIALLNLPRLKRILRWLGGTMFLAGLPVLVVFTVARLGAPGRVADIVSENVNDVPIAADRLLSDLVSSAAKDLSMSFVVPAAIILGVGVFCFVLSFVLGGRYDEALAAGEIEESDGLS